MSLQSERLKSPISQMDCLPTIPSLYTEIGRVLQYPQTPVEKVGELITRDIAMTAKILKLMNSAFYGLSARGRRPKKAAARFSSSRWGKRNDHERN
jgi:HD-like signal output (HDOD) protein